jgi:hypothetical protein
MPCASLTGWISLTAFHEQKDHSGYQTQETCAARYIRPQGVSARIYAKVESKKEMTDLEETAIAFFRSIRDAGKECLGHDQFGFTMNIETKSRKEDQESAVVLGAKIQEALTKATCAVQPVTIEGTSAQ